MMVEESIEKMLEGLNRERDPRLEKYEILKDIDLLLVVKYQQMLKNFSEITENKVLDLAIAGSKLYSSHDLAERIKLLSQIHGFEHIVPKQTEFVVKNVVRNIMDDSIYDIIKKSETPKVLFSTMSLGLVDVKAIDSLLEQYSGKDLDKVADCFINLRKNGSVPFMNFAQMIAKYSEAAPVAEAVMGITNLQEKDILMKFFDEHHARDCILDIAENIDIKNLKTKLKLYSNAFDIIEGNTDRIPFLQGLNILVDSNEEYSASAMVDAFQHYDIIKDTIEKNYHRFMVHSLLNISLRQEEHTIERLVNIIKLHDDKLAMAMTLSNIVDVAVDDGMVHKAARVFAKYVDNRPMQQFFVENIKSMNTFDYHELVTDKAYDQIKKSSNPLRLITKIATNDYSIIRNKIVVNDFAEHLSYSELDTIKKTYDMVMEIHTQRTEAQKDKVKHGFYDELNRAIDQGKDYYAKLQNLRRYCNEVRKNMEDNADDLMVMHNG